MARLYKLKLIIFVILLICGLLANITSAQQLIYNIPYARSFVNPHTETVIEIMNNNGAGGPVNVQINWFDQLGNPVGISGPVNIMFNCSRTFTTAAPGVPIEPYGIDVPRIPASPFEGYAKILVIPPLAALGVDATLVIDIDINTNFGDNYKSIKVVTPPGNLGD